MAQRRNEGQRDDATRASGGLAVEGRDALQDTAAAADRYAACRISTVRAPSSAGELLAGERPSAGIHHGIDGSPAVVQAGVRLERHAQVVAPAR